MQVFTCRVLKRPSLAFSTVKSAKVNFANPVNLPGFSKPRELTGRPRPVPRAAFQQYAHKLFICALALALCVLAAPAFCAETVRGAPAAGSQVKATPATVAKLAAMPPDRLAELDRRLASALTLYYDRKYDQALPLFQSIAREVETTDLMFWQGNCAMQLGKTDLAVKSYQKALAINPELHRVRLELSAALMAQRRYDEAKKEADRVLRIGPPDTVRDNIEKMLAEMEKRDRKTYYNLRLWMGYLWDDNVSFGPADRDYSVPGGVLRPGSDAARQSGQGLLASLSASMLYDLGAPRDLMWNTELSAYDKNYFEKSQFNYMVFDLKTGPWWMTEDMVARLPVGYTWRGYGNDRLSQTLHVDPNLFYRLNKFFSLQGFYSYSRENFFADQRSGLDNHNHRGDATAQIYLGGGDHIISFMLGYEDHRAEDGRFTYDGPYAAVGYRARLPWGSEVYLRYHYNLRSYQDSELFYGFPRSDRRYSYTAVVSHNFTDNFYASFNFNYVDIRSNIEIQTTDRSTYSLGLGVRF